MVSLVMFSFAIAGVLAVAVSMANGFREQRAGVGTEGAARAAMEFLSDAVRGASPGIESGIIWPMDDGDCLVDDTKMALRATMGNASGTDSLTVTFAYGSVVTTALSSINLGSTTGTITVEDGSQFADGDFVVVTDFDNALLFKITVSGNTLSYSSTLACTPPNDSKTGSPIALNAGAIVVRALRARFYVQDLDGVPTLYMDPDPTALATSDEEPLAEGIEDLQVVLGIDNGSDGLAAEDLATTDGDEWFGNLPGEVNTAMVGPIRAVRLSLVSRALTKVTGTASYFRPAVEDHDASTTDNYRRRVLTSVIEIRNSTGTK